MTPAATSTTGAATTPTGGLFSSKPEEKKEGAAATAAGSGVSISLRRLFYQPIDMLLSQRGFQSLRRKERHSSQWYVYAAPLIVDPRSLSSI